MLVAKLALHISPRATVTFLESLLQGPHAARELQQSPLEALLQSLSLALWQGLWCHWVLNGQESNVILYAFFGWTNSFHGGCQFFGSKTNG